MKKKNDDFYEFRYYTDPQQETNITLIVKITDRWRKKKKKKEKSHCL